MGLLKKTIAKALSGRVLTGPRKRFVFLYHDISDQDSPQYSPLYSTPIQKFKSQVELIARHFKLVPLEEIVAEDPDNKQRLASITFDDGFLSVKDEGLPFLQTRGIPFTVFVNTMAIKENRLFYGAKEPSINRTYQRKVFLDEGDVRELVAKGVVIGNHSATHKVLAECDAATLDEEVRDSKQYIEGLSGAKVRHFALPFGKREHYNEDVLNCCYSAGHEFIYSTNPSYFDVGNRNRNERLIPRVALLDESPEELYFLINRPLLKKIDI
jgi:peptidoglycan/xylan/chitin deacetylase (PgdA/CDA1 family)